MILLFTLANIFTMHPETGLTLWKTYSNTKERKLCKRIDKGIVSSTKKIWIFLNT